MSRFYRGVRDQLDLNMPLKKTPWGFLFSGHEQMASGNFEVEETQLVREILSRSDLFINAGANTGYYVCHALSLGIKTMAIEPIARNVHYLMKNIHANGWQQLAEIFPVAAGARSDISKIWGGRTGASLVRGWAMNSDEYVNFVPVLPLDRLVQPPNKEQKIFILIDVEGFEFALLQGVKKLLKTDPSPVWMVEITKTEHQPDKINGNPHFLDTFRFFIDAGYKAYRGDGSWLEMEVNELMEIDSGQKVSPCINYLFLSTEEPFIEPDAMRAKLTNKTI